MAEESKTVIRPSSRGKQPSLWKEVTDVNEKEQIIAEINIYTNLQRIKMAEDREKEIDYQIKASKAKLEAMGVMTEDLDIH